MKYFTIKELCASATATKLGIKNEPTKAAVLGVCLHGIAAEEYVRRKGGRYSMMAGDLLDMLQEILPK